MCTYFVFLRKSLRSDTRFRVFSARSPPPFTRLSSRAHYTERVSWFSTCGSDGSWVHSPEQERTGEGCPGDPTRVSRIYRGVGGPGVLRDGSGGVWMRIPGKKGVPPDPTDTHRLLTSQVSVHDLWVEPHPVLTSTPLSAHNFHS